LRKFLIDRLSAYAGEGQWKQVCGKAISEGAYVSQDQLRGIFSRTMKDLLINGNGKTKKLMEIESALIDSQRKITNLETQNEALRNHMERLEQRLTENNLSINKKIANVQEDQRNQAFEILDCKTKTESSLNPSRRLTKHVE